MTDEKWHLTDSEKVTKLLSVIEYMKELCGSLADRNAILEKNLREMTKFVRTTLAELAQKPQE